MSLTTRQRPLAVFPLLQSDLRRLNTPSPHLMTVEPGEARKNLTATPATACLEPAPKRNLQFHSSNVAPN